MAVRTVHDELKHWWGDTPELYDYYRKEHTTRLARFAAAVETGSAVYLPELEGRLRDFLGCIPLDASELSWDECWEWQGERLDGYGIFRQGSKFYHAHRLSLCLAIGQSFSRFQALCRTERREVCHTCENRSCVNPHHLLLGSHKYNMRTAVRSGRLKPPGDWRQKEREYRRRCWLVWSCHFDCGYSWDEIARDLNMDRAELIAMAKEVHGMFGRGQPFPD